MSGVEMIVAQKSAEVGANVLLDQTDRLLEEKIEADKERAKIRKADEALEKHTSGIKTQNTSAILNQTGNPGSPVDSNNDSFLRKKEFVGLTVECTPQIAEGIMLCENKEYAKAMRILRKNTENVGTVNWCRMQLFSSYATFFHASEFYFYHKKSAEDEAQKWCCGKPEPHRDALKEMRELIKVSLQDCFEVAKTILEAEMSVNGEELDLVCQMCFSIMSLGNAYQLEHEMFMDKALGLAAVWADRRKTVLANTELRMLESKRLLNPLNKIAEQMEGMNGDIKKLGRTVKQQGTITQKVSGVINTLIEQ
eukprot:TRINITY_DN1240_c0_g2_i1.p1 TRINITY_DN1240_c0_g2~~TRINITY_DN1240_c0_g2_i1.p1  ORF type:complete len:309 (+),score=64.52 TRINITY_DN1240_c0_g2_i1:55-981(+)